MGAVPPARRDDVIGGRGEGVGQREEVRARLGMLEVELQIGVAGDLPLGRQGGGEGLGLIVVEAGQEAARIGLPLPRNEGEVEQRIHGFERRDRIAVRIQRQVAAEVQTAAVAACIIADRAGGVLAILN